MKRPTLNPPNDAAKPAPPACGRAAGWAARFSFTTFSACGFRMAVSVKSLSLQHAHQALWLPGDVAPDGVGDDAVVVLALGGLAPPQLVALEHLHLGLELSGLH